MSKAVLPKEFVGPKSDKLLVPEGLLAENSSAG
jgi:hypothetical protein